MIGNRVVITRGDSYTFTVLMPDAGEDFNSESALYLGIMDPHQQFENALIKKKALSSNMDASGKVIFEIKPQDTLDLEPGIYYYAVKFHHVTKALRIDEVKTIIEKTKLVIND